jgi:methyltransferase family protein
MITDRVEATAPSTLSAAVPADRALMPIAGAYVISHCLHVVAELGIADHLDDAPATATELASAVGADADALARVLRVLAADGVFAQQDGAFTHTPATVAHRSPAVYARGHAHPGL